MFAQQTLHGRPLHTFTSAVNQAYDVEACFPRCPQVLIDDGHDIARRKGVQIDGVFDRQLNGVVFHGRAANQG